MNENYKSGFVTLIGRPNVGKSTLMNHLIGQKISITSNKPQTTRNCIQTVLTTEEGQIVFVDTPGIHKAKNKLGEYMVNVAKRTLRELILDLGMIISQNNFQKRECQLCLLSIRLIWLRKKMYSQSLKLTMN